MTAAKEKARLQKIRRQVKALPTGPGLYFMKGNADKVLYIGKANNLRARTASYFQPRQTTSAPEPPAISSPQQTSQHQEAQKSPR